MNTKWREWWKHALFPQIGGRVIAHRNLMQRWIPFGAWFYYFFAAWTTRRLLVIMVIALIPAAILFLLEIETYFIHIAFVITAAILMAITLGGILRPKVNIACVLPEIVETGRKFYINYLVQNTKWHPLIDLTVESCGFPNFRDLRLQQVKLSPLKIGETRQVVGYGIALKRGCYNFPPLRCDSDFPSGLWCWGRTEWQKRQIYVHPAYTQLMSLELPEGSRHHQDFKPEQQLARAALEFHSCREFRLGDSLRHIHARSSARLGTLVIKEFQAEGRGRTAVVVDTWHHSSLSVMFQSFPDKYVEAALSLAAAISDFLARTDRVLELLVAGTNVHHFISTGRIGYLNDVLKILAAVEASATDTLQDLTPSLFEEIRAIESACLIFTRWDDTRKRFVDELVSKNVAVKAVLIADTTKIKPKDLPANCISVDYNQILRGEISSL